MMRLLFGLLLLTSTLSYARTHEATISSIDYGRNSAEETLLYLSDGYVLRIPSTKNLKPYEDLRRSNKLIRFKTDQNRRLTSYRVLGTVKSSEETASLNEDYQPSILSSQNEAAGIFSALKRGWSSRSQCYNRAHIWVYESKNSSNLNAMKVFMFYTRKYIREFNFEWWFHVAPFTYIQENGAVTERVLDPRFTKAPLAVKSWTDIFMRNKVVCPVITQYSQYENHQEAEYCYLFKTSMYYLQPLDLDNLERTGKTKTKFIKYEVDRAYRNGFGWWW